jgi:hypothetical protein
MPHEAEPKYWNEKAKMGLELNETNDGNEAL